jgi:radical SAM protein with 4Fe4S-binding SPASM domain
MRRTENFNSVGLKEKKIVGMIPNELSAPIFVVLEVTNLCNLNCIHCGVDAEFVSNDKSHKDKDLSLKEIENLIKECDEIGVSKIIISGGEPLLREDIFDIINYIKIKGIVCCLSTNGTIINSEVASRLKYFGIHFVEITLNGPDDETNSEFFGIKGAFNKIVAGIKAILSESIPLKVNIICSKFNYPFIKETVKFLTDLGVSNVFLATLRHAGRTLRNRDKLMFSNNDYIDFLLDIESFLKEFKQKNNESVNIFYSGNEPTLHYLNPSYLLPICGAGRLHCTISSDGNVRPCPYFSKSNNFKAGNIREKKLKELWLESSIFKLLRNTEIPICNSCDESNCMGGCRIEAYSVYKNLLGGPDPYCNKNIINKIKKSLI